MLGSWFPAVAVVATCMAVTFVLSLLLRDNSIVDVTYGLAAALATAATLALSQSRHPREVVLFALVGLWGIRLAAHLLVRKWRQGEDFRYRAWRERWGRWFVVRSILQVYVLQGAVLLVILTPVLLTRSAPGGPLGPLDGLGVAVWAVGFSFEAVGDAQLLAFQRDRARRGRFLTRGLWRYTRHPNYFGEVTLWWGVFLVGLGARHGVIGVVSPVTITALLLLVSGIPLLEKRWEGDLEFEAYRRRTSALIPWAPREDVTVTSRTAGGRRLFPGRAAADRPSGGRRADRSGGTPSE